MLCIFRSYFQKSHRPGQKKREVYLRYTVVSKVYAVRYASRLNVISGTFDQTKLFFSSHDGIFERSLGCRTVGTI